MSATATNLDSAPRPNHLGDLLDLDLLDRHVEAGYVKVRQHPSLPLAIYNYAEKTAYERAWDACTSACRGLIVHEPTGTIVARPWPKFFNLGEHPEDAFDLDAPVEVTDKQDGSLGILVHGVQDSEPFLATRGSFTSEQAEHATEVYRSRYAGRWEPKWWATYLFEIVYPGNRIVLDYGDQDDLILLGAVDTYNGQTFGPNDPQLGNWPGPRTTVFEYATLRDALAAEPRTNAEGIVVRFPDTNTMLKVKQQDYIDLHRIVTGLNARVVWERCAEPDGLTALLDALPDEFQQWAIRLATALEEGARVITEQAERAHAQILRDLDGQGWTRKDYAMLATKSEHRALLFLLLDGRPIREQVWKGLRPSGDLVPRAFGEDTA